MKTLGLIGGTGWVSTVEYYRLINEMVNAELGGLNAAKCILYSFNYAEIGALNRRGDARGVYNLLCVATEKLESAGAECLLLCANTLHQFADELVKKLKVPLIDIAEATAHEINQQQCSRVGLLGTRLTMEADFYKSKLNRRNIDVLVPEKDDREFIHKTILEELLKKLFKRDSKMRFIRIIEDLKKEGAEAIVLGCTEIPLLIRPEDVDIPVFDTLKIHCRAAVDFALH